jgi:hypothetical protein
LVFGDFVRFLKKGKNVFDWKVDYLRWILLAGANRTSGNPSDCMNNCNNSGNPSVMSDECLYSSLYAYSSAAAAAAAALTAHHQGSNNNMLSFADHQQASQQAVHQHQMNQQAGSRSHNWPNNTPANSVDLLNNLSGAMYASAFPFHSSAHMSSPHHSGKSLVASSFRPIPSPTNFANSMQGQMPAMVYGGAKTAFLNPAVMENNARAILQHPHSADHHEENSSAKSL